MKKHSTVADKRYTEGFNDAILKVKSMIHSAKEEDVEPVIYAHWERTTNWQIVKCTACGHFHSIGWDEVRCPYCGAHINE